MILAALADIEAAIESSAVKQAIESEIGRQSEPYWDGDLSESHALRHTRENVLALLPSRAR